MQTIQLDERLRRTTCHPVVAFDPERDRLLKLDFTAANKSVTADIIADTHTFSDYISEQLVNARAIYGIGGYGEHRTVYSRSHVFDAAEPGEEPRRLHLGTDIWGRAGTPVFAPLEGVVHSFALNDRYGDYGTTLVLLHQIDHFSFHSLYGHLSLKDLDQWQEGKKISVGQLIAHFGEPHENGHWPPHLHFQLIIDMQGHKGDYPGVCTYSEREIYLQNCPDPDLLLNLMKYAGGS